MEKMMVGSGEGTKSLYGLPTEHLEKARKWDVELDTQRGCDHISQAGMSKWIEMMEEMANAPREEFGRREPGERQASEIYANRGTLPNV